MVGTLLKARNILDTNVTLPTKEGGPAILRLCNKTHMLHIVFKPGLERVCCTCSQANRKYCASMRVAPRNGAW